MTNGRSWTSSLSRILAALCVIGASWTEANAVKARPGLNEVTQPDGTMLRVSIHGDETFHYYLSEDGYPILTVGDTYYYASADASDPLKASPFKATAPDRRTDAVKEFLGTVDAASAVKRMVSAARDMTKAKRISKAPMRIDGSGRPHYGLFPDTSFPSTGEPKSLVILAEFANVDFLTPDAKDYFTEMMNGEGYGLNGATGSARDYFIDNSNGKFKPTFDVFGPVKLSKPMSYYGSNDDFGNDIRPHEMVVEACRLLDDEIDFTEYDVDGDGVVDNVFVFYAGRGEATGGGASSIWPHSFQITKSDPDNPHVVDGVQLDSYACTNEWVDNHTCGIGTFCHEFSHVMGLPDLYSVHYTGAFTPGDYTLMDSGSYCNDEKTPTGYSIFERYALGWIDPYMITGQEELVTLDPVQENRGAIIHAHDEGEFFLLENRQRTGWDKYLPGHGLLVWHVDYLERKWADNIVNDDGDHQYVDIVEADDIQTNDTRDGDTFPGAAGITSLTDDTTPSLRPWSNRKLKTALTDITETDGMITFKVNDSGNSGTHITATDGIRIAVTGRTLSVTAPEGAVCSVITPAGLTIYAGPASGCELTLPSAGIYLVGMEGAVEKIAVR
ncbi:MAG: M6 family metalloprotease domain-containing protein [Muribaculaceae bacterium]|nr:M6 family metalloprotease domain-containing protein [Muribaculaceae bacterium]